MDEKTNPDTVGSAYVATRCLLQASVITALCRNQPFYLLDCQYHAHAITKCNTVWELFNIFTFGYFTGDT